MHQYATNNLEAVNRIMVPTLVFIIKQIIEIEPHTNFFGNLVFGSGAKITSTPIAN